VAKLRRCLGTDCLESNTCVAHSFCLVGSQASYKIDPGEIYHISQYKNSAVFFSTMHCSYQ